MKYDLVFEGGGAKGMVFVGAMAEFFARGHDFGRLLGTSAGAITATLLAAGYTPDEMENVLREKDANNESVFTQFMGVPPPLTPEEIEASDISAILHGVNSRLIPDWIEDKLDDMLTDFLASRSYMRNVFAFMQRGGWYSAHAFITWLSRKLDSGMLAGQPRNFSQMTLKEFHAATQVDLSLIAADITGNQLLVLNYHTTPDCPLVYAVRMSMSIPLLWDEVIWRKAWGNYRKASIDGHAVVDGGVLSNFPIELFVSNAPKVIRTMGFKQDNPIIGCLIDESKAVPNAPDLPEKGNSYLTGLGKLDTVTRLTSLVNTMTQARNKDVIDNFKHLVVYCPAGGYGTMEFDMSDARRDALVAAGRSAMKQYLDNPPQPRQISPFETLEGNSAEIADRIANSILD